MTNGNTQTTDLHDAQNRAARELNKSYDTFTDDDKDTLDDAVSVAIAWINQRVAADDRDRDEVKKAQAIIAAHMYTETQAQGGETAGDGQYSYMVGRLPQRIWTLLDPYLIRSM